MARRKTSPRQPKRADQRRSVRPEPVRPVATGLPAWVSAAIVGGVITFVAVVLLARIGDPLGVRPDSWSEAEVIVSGWGYAASGFLAFAGLPQHQIGPPVDPYYLYANYPVLSNVLYGGLHLLGADAFGLYRLPVILTSLTALWLWYRLVARVIDRPTGMAAVVGLASSAGFLSYADNIHQQAYPLAPQFGALLCFVIALAPETKRQRPWLIGCALSLLLVGLLTVELHAWLVIAAAGYVVLFRARVPWRWLPVLLASLLIGVVLQSVQGRIGSPVPPEDRPGFTENLYRRSIGFAEAVDTPRDATGKRLTLVTYPGYMVERFTEFYRVPAWAVPLLVLIGFVGTAPARASPVRWPPQVKLLLILLAAALGWMGIMMQQTAVHPATMRQLLPFWALLLAVVWTQGVRVAFDARVMVLWRVLVPAVALVLVLPQAASLWSSLRMHWDPRYRDPIIMDAGWSESAELGPLGGLPRDSVILTNHNRLPLIRYWSRRPTYLASTGVPPGIPVKRSWFDLSVSYLRGLYQERLPHLVYLYRVLRPTPQNVAMMLARDPLLRALTTGSFDPLPSADAQRRAVQAFRGEVPATCPVLMRSGNWRVFDMAPIMPELVRRFGSAPIPTLREMPAPR
jgi:Dolichyl-phosphate-mannose-protein mannosyltransferase